MDTSFRNCPVAKYHNFNVIGSPYVAATNSQVQIEVCKHCGVRKEYHFKEDGSMVEEAQYFKDHILAFAQPSMGEVYFDIYPEARLRIALEEKEKKALQDKHLELSDKFGFAMKRAFDDKDDGI